MTGGEIKLDINEKELLKEKKLIILEKSKVYECSLVAMFWKDSELYFEKYDIVKRLIKTKIWKFYFKLGNKAVCNGVKILDEISIYTYLQNFDDLKKEFENFGGYNVIENAIDVVNLKNIDSCIENLKKYSIVYDFINDMTITKDRMEKLLELDNVEDISNFFDIKLDKIKAIVQTEDNYKTVGKLNDDLDGVIQRGNEGINVGLPLKKSPILSQEICGLRLGELVLFGGFSGSGKTSFTQEIYLSSMWETQESCVIFLNEQTREKWKQQFLTWIINNIILKDNNKKFKSKRWREGKFSQEELDWLYKAKEMLEEKINDNSIIIEELNCYISDDVRKAIKKYAKLGIKYFAIDTFKISGDYQNNNATWFNMQEDMRKYADLIKESNLNVNLWVTLQLEKSSITYRYITDSNIGMSKNIVDVADTVILMRNIRNDEYEKGRNKIKVVNPINLDHYKSGNEVELTDETENYNIIFIDKNRNGRSKTFQIVAKNNLGTLEYEEVGITSIPFGT